MSDTNDAGSIGPSATTTQDMKENELPVTDKMFSLVARCLTKSKLDSFAIECLDLEEGLIDKAKGLTEGQQFTINFEGLKYWYDSKKENQTVGAFKKILDHGITNLGLNKSVLVPLCGLEDSEDLKRKHLSAVSRRFGHNDWTRFSNEHNIDLSDNAAFLEIPKPDTICITLDILHTWRNVNYKDATVKRFKVILQEGIDKGFIDKRVQEALKDIIEDDLISNSEQEKTFRGIIRKHYIQLFDNLTDVDYIASILYEEKVFDKNQHEWIIELDHRQQKVIYLLRELKNINDEEQQNTFIEALKKAGNTHLAEKLKADMKV